MKEMLIALLLTFPLLLFFAWVIGYSFGYRDAKLEDLKEKSKGGSAGLGRGITLGQLSRPKKGGVR